MTGAGDTKAGPGVPGEHLPPPPPDVAMRTEYEARLRARWRRLKMTTPRRRATHILLAVLLILGGLVLAIVNGSNTEYQVTPLAPSGSFFSLAVGGNTIYAASANSGSIVLEKSLDRGLHWSTSSVPYSLIASNTSSWTHAAVAVYGSNIVVTASSGGPQYPQTGVAPAYQQAYACGANSTILLASSADGGVSWKSQTFVTPGLGVSSLQVGIDGAIAAVAWLGSTQYCPTQDSGVGAVTSLDGGASWYPIQNLTPANATVSPSQNLEMAESTQGIVVAFDVTRLSTNSNLLSLWRLGEGGSIPSFQSIYGPLAAPSSWTLQGDSGTPAFLLTPTYLIQLGSGGLTGIPFSQLQDDSGNIGALPNVVSLVPSSSSNGGESVEIAATMPQGSGVDCWRINLVDDSITQTCHVPLGSFLLSSDENFPIVSLLYGTGWWVAVGAGSPPSFGGGGYVGGAASAPTVGTSVCFQGCQSNEGLVAYYYTENPDIAPSVLTGVAALFAGVGALWLVLVLVARRSLRRLASQDAKTGAPSRGDAGGWPLPSQIRTTYLRGLLLWTLVWSPLAILAFVPGSVGSNPLLPILIIGGGTLGVLVAMPSGLWVRQTLQQYLRGPTYRAVSPGSAIGPGPYTFDRFRIVSYIAYASWFAIFLMLVTVWIMALVGRSSGYVTTPAGGTPELSLTATLLVILVLAVASLRALYHNGLATAIGDLRTASSPASPSTQVRGLDALRTRVGAALLPWNPLVGLLLGWALQPVTTWSPYLLAWIFLPVTLLGMALTGGFFGKTLWASAAWT